MSDQDFLDQWYAWTHIAPKKVEYNSSGDIIQLDLSGLDINVLPPQICQLRTLNLASNILSQLPETIDQLIHLEELNLNNNRLTQLPQNIGQLPNLHKFEKNYQLVIQK